MNNGARIGDLFGKDIIGKIQNNEFHGKNAKRTANLLQDKKDTQKIALAISENYPIKAIYPSITPECIRLTMENYRKHVHKYNVSVIEENEAIRKFNESVEIYISSNPLNEVQKEFSKVFMKKYGKQKKYIHTNTETQEDEIKERYVFNFFTEKSIRDYNEAVTDFCNNYGLVVKKRELQTIKPVTEKIFRQILFVYNTQLYRLNKEYIKIGFSKQTTLPKLIAHTNEIINFRKDVGIKVIDLSPRTLKRHIERLHEAGVLKNYEYSGTSRPPKQYINPEILVVFDEKTARFLNTENQQFSPDNWTVCPHNKKITRTYKDNSNISESDNVDIRKKGVSATLQQVSNFSFYKTTTEQDANLEGSAGGKNVKNTETLSEKLKNTLLHPIELAEKLSAGDYTNYTPIDIRVLVKEAYHGHLSRDEFREVVIQDFFKTAAKLYRGKNVFVGAWLNTINDYYNTKLLAFNGVAFNKYVLIDTIIEWRWRLEYARKWFAKHNEVRILFPSDYFDFQRKTNKEIGFEYTKKAYSNHLKSIEKTEARLKNQKLKAEKRQYRNTRLKMVDNKVNQFFRNKINYQELYNYVKNNYPEFTEKLALMINKKSTQYNC